MEKWIIFIYGSIGDEPFSVKGNGANCGESGGSDEKSAFRCHRFLLRCAIQIENFRPKVNHFFLINGIFPYLDFTVNMAGQSIGIKVKICLIYYLTLVTID